MIQRYLGRISGPLLDRIDLHVEVPAVTFRDLRRKENVEASATIRERTKRARMVQQRRGRINAELDSASIRKHCRLATDTERVLEQAVARLALSARAHDRILKVARTIADIEGVDAISTPHIAEAVQYRTLDRTYWV